MKRLNALVGQPSHLERYVSIRDRKHHVTRTQLAAAHPMITLRYAELEQSFITGDLAAVVPHQDALDMEAILRSCYGGATQPLRDLKKAISDAQDPRTRKYCPMCGTTLPHTHDHYMPAVHFPEFAVHPLNLIPCCSRCNSTKDDDWLSNAGVRQFLHAYMDTLPDAQFVHVALHEQPPLRAVGAVFSLQRPDGLEDDLWRLIESHFGRLHLLRRYDEQGNGEIAEILADCRVHLDSGGEDARIFLQRRAQDRSQFHGRNHWIAVLMAAMAQHPNLLVWLQVPQW